MNLQLSSLLLILSSSKNKDKLGENGVTNNKNRINKKVLGQRNVKIKIIGRVVKDLEKAMVKAIL